MATIYDRLINKYKFKYHILSSASFYKISEENQRSDEIEKIIKLNINHKLTETFINDIDVESQLEHQIQIQEIKQSGWIFYKNIAMKIRLYKTGELNGSNYVEISMRSNAILNIKNTDKYCFLRSILAFLHPCEKSHASRVTIYIQSFIDLNIEGFNFKKRFQV